MIEMRYPDTTQTYSSIRNAHETPLSQPMGAANVKECWLIRGVKSAAKKGAETAKKRMDNGLRFKINFIYHKHFCKNGVFCIFKGHKGIVDDLQTMCEKRDNFCQHYTSGEYR